MIDLSLNLEPGFETKMTWGASLLKSEVSHLCVLDNVTNTAPHAQGNPLHSVERETRCSPVEASVATKFHEFPESDSQDVVALQRHSCADEPVSLNALPTELLRPIFAAGGQNVDDKFAIIETCVRWRDICFAFPHFWTTFELPTSYEKAELALRLARQTGFPLRITVDWSALKPNGEYLLRLLSAHTIYIEHLGIRNWTGNWLLDSHHPFPRLRSLNVARLQDSVLGRVIYPEVACDWDLREVALHNCHFPFIPSYYTHLTRLSMEFAHQEARQPLIGSFDGSVLECLRTCPDLEELTLRRVPVYFDDVSGILSQHIVVEPVFLPRLRHLDLQLYPDEMTVFMTLLRTTSALRSVVFDIDVLHAQDLVKSEWDRLAPLKPHLLTLPSAECFPMLSNIETLVIEHGATCELYDVFGPAQAVTPPDDGPAYLRIGMAWNPQSPLNVIMRVAYENLVKSLLQHHTLQRLSHLSLRHHHDIDSIAELFSSILRTAPAIVHLNVTSHCRNGAEGLSRLVSDAVLSNRPVLLKLAILVFESYDSDEILQLESIVGATICLPSLRVLRFTNPATKPVDPELMRRFRRDGLQVEWVQ
ncbi:hypothetical protein C8Q80DRAFT_478729 [Daedaleopsis nitida]|nr:hypothetical protein C8Q80DRAFT_478729 [Daedaleopsis nitida]